MSFRGNHTTAVEDTAINATDDVDVIRAATRLDDKVSELTSEKDEMAKTIEDLNEQVKELSRKLDTSESELAECREINQRIQT